MDRKKTGFAVATASTGIAIALFLLYSRKKTPRLLNPNVISTHKVPLVDKIPISPDTYNFKFGLPTPNHVLGLSVGQHVSIHANVNGEEVKHAYTPVTSDDDKGHFDIIIKIYKANVNPKFPGGGKLTQYLDQLKLGDLVTITGPKGRLLYKGNGHFEITNKITKEMKKCRYEKVGMIAGGTGIAPMLQLIEAVLKSPQDKTQLYLLFANQSEEDILVRDRLEELQKLHVDQFYLWYTIDRASDNWKYSVGYVDANMIREHLPPPADDTAILLCGPKPMVKLACFPNLDKLGYKEEHRFKY